MASRKNKQAKVGLTIKPNAQVVFTNQRLEYFYMQAVRVFIGVNNEFNGKEFYSTINSFPWTQLNKGNCVTTHNKNKASIVIL